MIRKAGIVELFHLRVMAEDYVEETTAGVLVAGGQTTVKNVSLTPTPRVTLDLSNQSLVGIPSPAGLSADPMARLPTMSSSRLQNLEPG